MNQPDSQLTTTLTLLALAVLKERSLSEDLQRLAMLATQHLVNSSGASVALLVDGQPSTIAVTDHIALKLDLVQYNTDEGPCLTALSGRTVRVASLPEDERFAHFAISAADQRIKGVLSTPIRYDGETIGTLNVYSRQADAFDETDQRTADVIAAEAANAIAKSEILTSARTVREKLQEDYDERTLVSSAQRVLTAVQKCSATQALHLIHSAADSNLEPLVVIATRILDSVQSESIRRPHSPNQ